MILQFDKITATLCLLIGIVIGSFLAHQFYMGEIAHAETRISALKEQRATDIATTHVAALKRIQTANARADSLQVALEVTEQRLSITELEMQHEIQRNTSGRACLSSRTVSLLNQRAAAGNTAAGVSTSASQPAENSAAVATDTDIASWANVVITQYGACKARLDALIGWHFPEGVEQHD